MHLSPEFMDTFQHNNNHKDMPIAMPMRRPSLSRRSSSLTMKKNTLAKLISSTSSRSAKIAACPELYESQSSLLCLGGSSHHKSYHCHVDDFMKTGNRSRSGVRFAPTTESRTIMNLRDYTKDEIEACWYSKEELDCLQGKPRSSPQRRTTITRSSPTSSSKRRKRFQCRPCKLMRGKSRWSA